ncbi:MAG TPA: hypothetical protein PL110_01990 [Candidatus Eremiobacteraeota bacterium]|nr:MAG: hypothetical protein BWY64_02270 [bacterium ADurb.Bin363]HPZ06861.1 hypothetical protein [Candidatus Eremiobacteraeota bacterium]
MDRVNKFFLQNAMKGNVISSTISAKDLKGGKTEEKTDSRFSTRMPVKGKDGAKKDVDLQDLQSKHDLQKDNVEQTPDRAIKKFFGKADELYETAKKADPNVNKNEKASQQKDKNIRAGGYRFKFSTKGGKLLLSQGTVKWLRNEPGKMQDFHKMLQGQFIQTQDVDIRTARQILDGVTRQLNDIASQLSMPDSQQIMNCLSVLSDLLSSFVNFDTKNKLKKLREKTKKAMKGCQYDEMEGQEGEGGKYGDMKKLGQKLSWFQNLEEMVQGELDQLMYDPRAGDRRKFLRKALTIVGDIKLKLLAQSAKELETAIQEQQM